VAGASIREPIAKQCGILNISQPYRPSWPVTGIALFIHLCTFYIFNIVIAHTYLNVPSDRILCFGFFMVYCVY
jgi:hypothetical protein